MKHFFVKLLLLSCFLYSSLGAIIIETTSFETMEEHVDKDTVVVFDLDYTVGENSIDLDTWISYNIEDLKQQKGIAHGDAFFHTILLYHDLQNAVGFHELADSHSKIASLQDRGIPVIALTNRSFPVLEKTKKQLESIGVDFSKTSLYKEDIDVCVTHRGICSDGIIFCGANDKGTMLFNFFDSIGYVPKKIIFIDDKLKYVQSVERVADERNVLFVGLRFALKDEKKKAGTFERLSEEVHELMVQIGLAPLT